MEADNQVRWKTIHHQQKERIQTVQKRKEQFKEEKIGCIEQQMKIGSISVNQVMKQAASPRIPFGGVGESGFGRYHGEKSFETFSYQKVKFTQKNLSNVSLKYPPYNKDQLKWIKKFRKWLF